MRPGAVLTQRDRQLLDSLRACRLLTAAQIQRLHFPSSETTHRRLRRLEAAGLIEHLASPSLASRLVTLTGRGAEIAASGGAKSSDFPRARRLRAPRPLFLEHHLAVNDFRIALALSLRRHPDIELAELIVDSDRSGGRHGRPPRAALAASVSCAGGELIRHIPDGAFVLRRGEHRALFFLEVDRGSETIASEARGVGKLVRFYLHLLSKPPAADWLAAEQRPRSARLLLVTTSARRIGNIRACWGTRPFQPEVAKRFIWLTSSEALHCDDLLRSRWHSLDPSDAEPYVIARNGQDRGQ